MSNYSSSAGGGGGGGFFAAPFASFAVSLLSFGASFPFLSSLDTVYLVSDGQLEPPKKSTDFLAVRVLAKALIKAGEAFRFAAFKTFPMLSALT